MTPQPAAVSIDATKHFTTLAPGRPLPSDGQCAELVNSVQIPENKRMNRTFNRVTGQSVGEFFPAGDDPNANALIAPRIDGKFTGTTGQILRWAACKWGIDEDLVAAQAAVESWWRQTTLGDWDGDSSACPPGHQLGSDGRRGQCPQSYGILQNRYPDTSAAWPGLATSTAMNVDTAYAVWRACYEGYEVWLNDVDHRGQYVAGDAWGCIGRWYSGRWHTSAADGYIAKVRDYMSRRVWTGSSFQES